MSEGRPINGCRTISSCLPGTTAPAPAPPFCPALPPAAAAAAPFFSSCAAPRGAPGSTSGEPMPAGLPPLGDAAPLAPRPRRAAAAAAAEASYTRSQ
jgi:hypothetical protein